MGNIIQRKVIFILTLNLLKFFITIILVMKIQYSLKFIDLKIESSLSVIYKAMNNNNRFLIYIYIHLTQIFINLNII